MPNSQTNQPPRTLLLTGASRGIGHATVKTFLGRGLARHHLLAPSVSGKLPVGRRARRSHPGRPCRRSQHKEAIEEIKRRLTGGELHALVNNAAISPKAEGGKRLGSLDTAAEVWHQVFQVNFLRADHAGAGLVEELKAAKGSVVERHLDRRLACASLRGRRLRDVEGGARVFDPRNGVGLRPARHSRQRHRAGRNRHLDSVAGHREDRRANSDAAPRHARQVAKIIYVLCTETSSYVNGAEIHINGGQHV